MRASIPNILTLANLLCGVLAIIYIFDGLVIPVLVLMGLSLLFDFFDGFAARLLGVAGDLGKQLDSLADVVSFGVVPGLMLWRTGYNLDEIDNGFALTALLIPVFSAYRLAKFNIDERPGDHFYGLPTPANTLWVVSWVATGLLFRESIFFSLLLQDWFYPIFTGISCWLLISDVPMLSLKFKNFNIKQNLFRYFLMAGTAGLILFLGIEGAAFIIPLYLILSLIKTRF
jgi:CDP-diacylglycerol--serine O-phosphatidyltransferase